MLVSGHAQEPLRVRDLRMHCALFFDDTRSHFDECPRSSNSSSSSSSRTDRRLLASARVSGEEDDFARILVERGAPMSNRVFNSEFDGSVAFEYFLEMLSLLRVRGGIPAADLRTLIRLYSVGQRRPHELILDWDETTTSASGLLADSEQWYAYLRRMDERAFERIFSLMFGDVRGTRLRLVVRLLNVACAHVTILTSQENGDEIRATLRELQQHWGLSREAIRRIPVVGLAEREQRPKCEYIIDQLRRAHADDKDKQEKDVEQAAASDDDKDAHTW